VPAVLNNSNCEAKFFEFPLRAAPCYVRGAEAQRCFPICTIYQSSTRLACEQWPSGRQRSFILTIGLPLLDVVNMAEVA